jgi:hypothetical protein
MNRILLAVFAATCAFTNSAMASDVLKCSLSSPIQIEVKGNDHVKSLPSVQVLIYRQNDNLNYATLRIDDASIGIDDYQRSPKGEQVRVAGWQSNVSFLLKPSRGAQLVSTKSATHLAYATYEGKITTSAHVSADMQCQFSYEP